MQIIIPMSGYGERFKKAGYKVPKPLIEVDGKPIIQLLVERLQKVKNIKNIVICTTDDPSDDELVKFLEKMKINFFRGSINDILDRFLKTTQKFSTDFIIAVDGDDIYCDPDFVQKILTEFEKHNADCYHITGVPVGFTPIGFKTSALEKICSLKTTTNTETGYIRFFLNKKLFDIHEIKIKKFCISLILMVYDL